MEEKLLLAHSRANSYMLVSRGYCLPDTHFLAEIKEIPPNAGELWRDFSEGVSGLADLETLRLDFSRLFVGPYKLLAPPYGSIYLDLGGKIFGNSTVDLLEYYRDEGIEVSIREVPDHISIELEFMYFQINKEILAIQEGSSEEVEIRRNKQLAFLKMHLSAWVPAFSKIVIEKAQTSFYKSLGRITEAFVMSDLAQMESVAFPKKADKMVL